MILHKQFSAIKCDNCGVIYGEEDAFECYWHDEEYIEKIALNDGWVKEEGKHYCDDCYSYDNDDKLVLKNTSDDR